MGPAFIDCLIYWTNSPVTEMNVNRVEDSSERSDWKMSFKQEMENVAWRCKNLSYKHLPLIADGIPLVISLSLTGQPWITGDS